MGGWYLVRSLLEMLPRPQPVMLHSRSIALPHPLCW
ncbi:hypothetical protein CGRA01v4_05145 [Colletotrichum graminicola]|nr:hypothetical protein CGRA01v4_05145 [Colletotrichum graminicola]